MTENVEDARKRAIRTFVVRAGRMSAAQTRAIDTLAPKFGIAYSPSLLDVSTAFSRSGRLVIEIGFGMGVATAQMAAQSPETNFLGIEVHPPGVGNLFKLVENEGLHNIRVVQHDAVEVLTHMFAQASVDAIHIYFPDPWHKTRHHKRRMIQPAFTSLLASRLRAGGMLHLATDWEPYAHWMLEVLAAEPQLHNAHATFCPEKPAWRPTTKFETRGIKLGHGVWDLVFLKK